MVVMPVMVVVPVVMPVVVAVVRAILLLIVLVTIVISVVIVAIGGRKSSEATKITTVITPEWREEKLRLRRFNYSGRASSRDHGREY